MCVFWTNDRTKKHSESFLSLFCHHNGWNILLWINILLKWKWTEEDNFCWILIYTQILYLFLSLPLCLSFPLSRGQHVEHIRGLSVTSLNALALCRCEDGIKRQLDCSEGWCLCYKVKSAEDGRTEQGIEVELKLETKWRAASKRGTHIWGKKGREEGDMH